MFWVEGNGLCWVMVCNCFGIGAVLNLSNFCWQWSGIGAVVVVGNGVYDFNVCVLFYIQYGMFFVVCVVLYTILFFYMSLGDSVWI